MSVDAILCYHNHRDVVADCLHSLYDQIRQCILVDDGSDEGQHIVKKDDNPRVVVLTRDTQHSPANSFNYGAKYSNADWLLYVDPHTILQPGAIQAMLDLAHADGYDFILGTGTHYLLDASDPWIHALGPTLNTRTAPWTFLLSRRQWNQWQGIPEVPYAHMELLAAHLLRTGVLIGVVEGCCDHVVNRDWRYALDTFYTTARGYALLEAEHLGPVTQIAAKLTSVQIAALWDRVFASLHLLGAVDGLGKIPQTALPLHLTFEWRNPPSSGSA
jgi:glycosyltransferase involved in cell wall biosynthesis